MHVIKNRVSEEIGTVEQKCEENRDPKQDTRQASDEDGKEKMVAKEESILRLLKIVKKADIDKRPPLPNIRHSRKSKLALETANNALQNIKKKLEQQLSLAIVNELFYASASADAEALVLQSRARIHKRLEAPKWKKNN